MRVYTKTELHWDEAARQYHAVPIEWFEYEGQVAKCDRAAQAEAKNAAGTAAGTAASAQGAANAEHASLLPFYKQEMDAQHFFSPEQSNELLNYAEQGAGGSNSSIVGQAQSEAARTRNTSGFSAALDEAARDRQKALSSSALGVGEADIMGAKQLNQEGAAGEAGLFGADTETMLKSMGIETGDINSQIEAGKSGWFQNLMSGINTAANGAAAAAGVKKAF